jgi:multidrug resistance efflux pump
MKSLLGGFEMRHIALSRRASGFKLIRLSIVLATLAIVSSLATACRSSQSPQADIAVNAPATGVVRSVLVAEGAAIQKDAAIIEIAVSSEQAGEQVNQQKDKDAQQARAESAARTNVVAAEADANRTLVELRRIEPLVKRGLASQAELNKARAQNQDAQARLQRAREQEKSAGQQRDERSAPGGLNEEIVAVRAPTAGKIHQIKVQAGQQVTAGQTLATVSSGS